MSNNISYRPSENILCQKIGNEAVLLDLESSKYFGLTPVATRVWDLLADGQPVGCAAETVAAEYQKPVVEVLTDILAFVETAASRGLLTERA